MYKSSYIPEDIYIRGRTTGDSHGVFNDLKDILVADEFRDDGSHRKVFTIEHSILDIHGKAFSVKGDPGSLVWDKEHAIAGMLFAGYEAIRTSYFTHKDDLFMGILPTTGAKGIKVHEREA